MCGRLQIADSKGQNDRFKNNFLRFTSIKPTIIEKKKDAILNEKRYFSNIIFSNLLLEIKTMTNVIQMLILASKGRFKTLLFNESLVWSEA